MKNPSYLLILRDLLKLQNQDGGWGWEINKQSNVEATAYALMGLSQEAVPFSHQSQLEHGRKWLLSLQHENGAWPYTVNLPADSWVTALAILALSASPRYRHQCLQGATWLLRQKGERLGLLPSLLYRLSGKKKHAMNPDLQGWAWTPHTASWVEPTAYAFIALRKMQRFMKADDLLDKRLRQGEALLYNRMCVGGGWNYGNAVVLREHLVPYPDITAIGLIALQHHQTKHENQISLQALNRLIKQQKSGLTLSWAIICRALYGQSNDALKHQLMDQYQVAGFLGQSKSLALSLIALGQPAAFFEV